MPRIWALIVCIEAYGAHSTWVEALGATQDAANIRDYLLRDQGVPRNQIHMLINTEATRSGIISAFIEHLIENKDIQRGDAILFYFSGHGSRCTAPPDWPIVESRDTQDSSDRHMLEVLIPFDESTRGRDGRLICGIPDRTLGALLTKAARVHGENITVILDCCHSGHATRKDEPTEFEALDETFTVREVPADSLAPLWQDLDREIWAEDIGSPSTESNEGQQLLRGAFTERIAKSHVLLASCGQRESSLGSRRGGLFTTALLKALRDKDVSPRSYSEIMKHVSRSVEHTRSRIPAVTQHPQCEGVLRNRIVFQSAEQHHNQFEVRIDTSTRSGNATCFHIEAGAIQGVRPNTMFDIYEDQNTSRREGAAIGTVMAREVFATTCKAYPTGSIHLRTQHFYARISGLAYSLTYAISNVAPHAAGSHRIVDQLRRRIHSVPSMNRNSWHEIHVQGNPDLQLEVDDAGITLRRCDPILRDLPTAPPRINGNDVEEYFPDLFITIARFNFFLAHENPRHPFAERVHFELHLLESDHSYDILDDDGDLEFISVRKLRKQIAFRNDEARIEHAESDNYAFVLRNLSSTPLFPHLIYFDPSTYAIENWYSPFHPDQPTLLPRNKLQIGASPEHQADFSFFLVPGERSDTSFVKLILLDTPAQLSFIEQNPILGCDENGVKHVHKRGITGGDGESARPLTGRWDSLTRRITVVSRADTSRSIHASRQR